MAIQHGRTGVIQIDSVAVAHIKSWSYSESVDEVDVTAMGDTAKSYQAGLRDGTLDIECMWDAADAGQEDILDGLEAGTGITVNIYPTGATTNGEPFYTGTITITSNEVSAGVDDMVTAKFSGRGFLTLGTVS